MKASLDRRPVHPDVKEVILTADQISEKVQELGRY